MKINGGENIKNGNEEKKDEDKCTSKLEAIYREYWGQARQCVNERLQFASIHTVAVSAILIFIAQIESRSVNPTAASPTLLLSLFGLLLSVIGFMVTVSLSLGYDHYIGDITMILYYWDKMEFYRHPGKPATFRDVHRKFYEITIAFFAVLILFYLSRDWTFLVLFREQSALLIVIFIIIYAVIEVLYQWKWEKYATECSRFKKALQYDFEGKYRQDQEEWETWFKKRGARKRIIKDARKSK